MSISKNTRSLITSLFLENFATQLCFLYLPILYLMRGQDSVAFVLSSLQFIGPFAVGSIAGVIVDALYDKRGLWKLPLIISVMVALVAWSVTQLGASATILALIGLSFSQYLSTNARISVSRHVVPSEQVSQYHRWVVTALESVALAAPVTLSVYLTLFNTAYVLFALIIISLMASTLLLRSAIRTVENGAKNDLKPVDLYIRLKEGVAFVYNDKALWYTSLTASFSNFFVAGITLLAVARILALYPSFKDASPLILVALGVGSIAGSAFQGTLKAHEDKHMVIMQIGLVLLTVFGVGIGVFKMYALIFACLFLTGMITAFLTIIIWGVRFKKSQTSNIGSIAGITGALYKALPVLGLPILGVLATHISTPSLIFGLSLLMLLPVGLLFGGRSTEVLASSGS